MQRIFFFFKCGKSEKKKEKRKVTPDSVRFDPGLKIERKPGRNRRSYFSPTGE